MLKDDKKKVLLVFFIFFTILLFQHHFMWLYHDDYGYASLSYVGDIYKLHNLGFHTTIADIYKFCIYHYNNWGGRVLYFFFECNIMRFGIHAVRIIQSLAFTLIFYYIYKILSYLFKKEDYKLAIFIASLYGVFELALYKDGILWFTASILYIIPLLPLLIFIYRYVLKNKNKSILDILIGCILIFLASFSQEQVSALVVGFIILYELDKAIKNKKFEIKELPVIISSLIGFVILLLCPGNKNRMSMTPDFYNLSLLSRLKKTIPDCIMTNFGEDTKIFTLIFFLAIAFIAYENLINKKNKKLYKLNILSLLSSIFILLFSFIKTEGYFRYVLYLNDNFIYKAFVFGIIIIQLLLIVYSISLYFYQKKKILLSEIFVASLGSQVVMFIAPYYSLRCVLMMQIMLFIIIGYVAYEFYKKNGYKLFIPLIIILIINYAAVTAGYINNNYENSYNDKVLTETSEKIKNGEDIKYIELKKLKSTSHASCLAYEEGYDYIYKYMKIYYSLPEDIVIEYK